MQPYLYIFYYSNPSFIAAVRVSDHDVKGKTTFYKIHMANIELRE